MDFSSVATNLLLLQASFLFAPTQGVADKKIPLVVITWDYLEATQKGN